MNERIELFNSKIAKQQNIVFPVTTIKDAMLF